MKSLKKYLLGVALSAVFAIVFLGFVSPASPAKAAGPTSNPQDIKSCMQNLTFVSIAEVDCTFTPVGAKSAITVKFIDSNPTDANGGCGGLATSCPNVLNYAQQGDFFHNGSTTSSTGNPFGSGNVENGPGISVQNPGTNNRIKGPLSQDNAGKAFNLEVNLQYLDNKTGQFLYPCKNFANSCSSSGRWDGGGNGLANTDAVGPIMKGSKTQGLATLLQFDGQDVVSLNSVTQGSLADRDYGLDASYTNGPLIFTQGFTTSPCGGDILIVTKGDSSVTAEEIYLNNKKEDLHTQFPRLLAYLNFKKAGDCGVDSTPDINQFNINFFGTNTPFNISGTVPKLSDGSGTIGGTTGSDFTGCAGFSNIDPSVDWFICPIVSGLSKAADAADGFVQGQLNFDTGQNLNDSIHRAWAVIKDLVSAVLVLIMLVMVIAQALNSGSFMEAYTIRKLLPRIVAAVILMQISWNLGIYAIKIANDFGQGIGDLLASPFGGQQALNLQALVHDLNPAWAVTTGGWIGVLIAGIGVYLFWPMILLGALLALMATIAALATLLVRNVLIVVGIIVAPLAFIAWILPGTQELWKKWKSNVSKALMLFPLVMAAIIGGRIFAWVVANRGGAAGPLDTIMVFAGYLLPYFFLPKMFKYGGDILSQASQGINKARDSINKNPKSYMGDLQKRWGQYRREQSQERVANNEPFNRRRPWQFPLDQLRSGRWNPLLGRAERRDSGTLSDNNPLGRMLTNEEGGWARQHQVDRYVEEGEKSQREKVAAAEARIIRERQTHRARGGDHDVFLQAIADGLTEFRDPSLNEVINLGRHSDTERVAARQQLSKLGAGMNWRFLENYFEATTQEREAALASRNPARIARADAASRNMRKFFDDNVETIISKLPHIYRGLINSADSDPATIANMHGVGVEAILSNLSTIINGQRPGNRQVAERGLATFLENFQRAVESSQRGGPQLENGALRAVKGFLDNNPAHAVGRQAIFDSINDEQLHSRRAPGRARILPGEAPRVLVPLPRSEDVRLDPNFQSIIDNLRVTLAPQIDPAGFVVNVGGNQPPPPPPPPPPPLPDYRREQYGPGGGSVGQPRYYAEPGVTSTPERAVPIAESQPREGESLNLGHTELTTSDETLANIEDATFRGTRRALRETNRFNQPPGSVSTPLPRPRFQPPDRNDGDQAR